MGSLIAGVFDDTPYVPSAPVEIGTSGPHHGVAEAGSWQVLIIMFGLVVLVGAAVLMYVVRQRTRLLERRRVRRMAEAQAAWAAQEAARAALADTAAQGPRVTKTTHTPHLVHSPHPVGAAPASVRTTPRTTPATPG